MPDQVNSESSKVPIRPGFLIIRWMGGMRHQAALILLAQSWHTSTT
jgi:hypothetical protein